jgi:UDP-GlcNAc:undecaprenyl-phosphate GlcNAc-1-phosphate transferase
MTPMFLGGGLALAAATSFIFSLVLSAAARRIAQRVGFVDRPGAGSHKTHREPIPYGGGLAIFVATFLPPIAATVAVFLLPDGWIVDRFGETARDLAGGVRNHSGQAIVIIVGAAVLLVLGLIDDRRPLGPWVKLATITGVACFVAIVGRVRIAEFAHPAVSIALTVLWILVITNAFNFLDNMDGLSAGVAAVCSAFLLVSGVMAGQIIIPAMAAALLGATIGFLVHNFPPARLFMGDAGSLFLGYMLSVLSVLTSYWESGGVKPAFALAIPLAILAVPLYDFASVVVIRVFEGRNPLKGDQRHFSHRLVERGLSRRSAVLTIYLATATTGLASTLLIDANLREMLSVLAIVAMTLAVIAILEAPLRRED